MIIRVGGLQKTKIMVSKNIYGDIPEFSVSTELVLMLDDRHATSTSHNPTRTSSCPTGSAPTHKFAVDAPPHTAA